MYVVVYSNSWEDIAYFTDFEMAKMKLLIQTAWTVKNESEFQPFINEYEEGNGLMYRTKNSWIVDKASFTASKEALAEPKTAFEHIRLCM